MMLHKVLLLAEALFLLTFWWQTRVNLREWWPDFFTIPLNSDYVTPFVYISDVFLICLLGAWLLGKVYGAVRLDLRNVFQLSALKSPLLWLLTFAVVAALSLIINEVGWWGWYGWMRLIEGVLFGLYIRDRLRNLIAAQWYMLILLIGLTGESILLICEWFLQRSMGLQWIGEWRFDVLTPGIAKITFEGAELLRSHGTFPHPNVAGGILALAIILLFWLGLNKLGPWKEVKKPGWIDFTKLFKGIENLAGNFRPDALLSGDVDRSRILGFANHPWVIGVALGLFGLGLLVTFSRSAWLVVVLGVLMVAVSTKRPQLARMLSRWWWSGLLIALIVGLIFGPMIFSRFTALDSTDGMSVDRRVQLVEVANELWQDNQWLGVGVNNFVPELAGYGPLYGIGIWREPVHNLFLLIAAEVGSLGFITWTLFLAALLWILVRSMRGAHSKTARLLLILWIGLLLLGMVDHYWWTSQQGRLVLWLLVGVSLSMQSARADQRSGMGDSDR